MDAAALAFLQGGRACAGRSGDVDTLVEIRRGPPRHVVRMLHGHVAFVIALMTTDYQQLVGDERGGQAVVVLAGARRAVTRRIHHQHVGVLAA